MKTGWILAAIGIGAFLGVVVVCGGLGAGFLYLVSEEMEQQRGQFGVAHGGFQSSHANVDYTLTGPDEVRVGEPATFIVEVTNTSTSEHHSLYSLDLYTELVDQGAVDASPSPKQDNPGSSYAELVYELDLPPGATEQVEVTFHPSQAGQYNVNIDACIDTTFDFIERFHDLAVLPAGG
ncbi:MAG: hypothetical protein WD534_05030 [Phycisphaeraceae bacterium]